MKSYVKIYGPPVLKAVKALETMAIEMPQICIMDAIIAADVPDTIEETEGYFNDLLPAGSISSISAERCEKIISSKGEELGEYDFFFEWFADPSQTELNELIGKIDETLAKVGCRYSIVTK